MTLLDPSTPTVADYKRDRWGRPLIVPASGGKAKPYTRASSAAKTIEDTYGLEMWARRNVAFGLAHDSSLVARLLAVGGTPQTWTKADKDAVAKIVDDAATVAQAHKGADIGTAVHRLTERLDLGEDVQAGHYEADLTAYTNALAAAGFTVDPRYVECRMVCDELEMAGTADRILVSPGGVHYIADLKTGASADFGGLGWASQLAAYANGDLYDPATDQRIHTPPINRDIGVIIHLPAGTGTCTLYSIDLRKGMDAARLANEVRRVRKESKQWLTVLAETVAKETSCESSAAPTSTTSTRSPSAPRSSSTTSGTPTTETTVTSSSSSSGSATTSPTPSSTPSHPDRAERLRQRFFLLNDADRAEFRSLLLDPDDLDGIEAALDRIDQFAHVKVAPLPPDFVDVSATTQTLNLPHGPDEGADVGDAEFESLSALYDGLTGEGKAWFVSLVDQARTAGVSFHGHKSTGKRTVRRFEIYRGLLTLAGWTATEQETRRAS